ncbi:hypothetical protein KC327_g32 [Hortaea werneckii]|nr:hypothetical protein KC327_g32 [Hortaea werneckii]
MVLMLPSSIKNTTAIVPNPLLYFDLWENKRRGKVANPSFRDLFSPFALFFIYFSLNRWKGILFNKIMLRLKVRPGRGNPFSYPKCRGHPCALRRLCVLAHASNTVTDSPPRPDYSTSPLSSSAPRALCAVRARISRLRSYSLRRRGPSGRSPAPVGRGVSARRRLGRGARWRGCRLRRCCLGTDLTKEGEDTVRVAMRLPVPPRPVV